MATPTKEVMDIEGLGKYLQLAPVTLYKMVKEEKIPYRRIGKSLRFPKGMIDAWLNQPPQVEPGLPPTVKKVLGKFVKEVRSHLSSRVREIRLYGSFARGEGRLDSDIDVAVIVEKKDLELVRTVRHIAADLSLEADLFLSAVVIEEQAHQQGKKEGYLFHLKLDKQGIVL